MSRKGAKTEQKQEKKAMCDRRPIDCMTSAASSPTRGWQRLGHRQHDRPSWPRMVGRQPSDGRRPPYTLSCGRLDSFLKGLLRDKFGALFLSLDDF